MALFVQNMFPSASTTCTDEWLLKFDTVFQIFSYWLNSGKMTPIHCSLAQTVNSLSQSRQRMDIMNRLGLSMSYDSMKRIDTTIAERMAEDTLPNRCPVSDKINTTDVIQGAIDNFDHADNTISGKDTTHDTVLVVFQNKLKSSKPADALPTLTHGTRSQNRKFADTLPYQVIEKSGLNHGTSEIGESFQPLSY